MSSTTQQVFRLFPEQLQETLRTAAPDSSTWEEIHVQLGKPLHIKTAMGEQVIAPEHPVSNLELRYILTCATAGSYHTYIDSIRQGYVPLPGGCRLGICGEGSSRNGQTLSLRNLSSLCIRIPHAAVGCGDKILPHLLDENGFHDTLILSPPGMGKTTLLRELIRTLSDSGYRISVADERGEIAAAIGGQPQFDLGEQCDILSGIPKCKAAIMMIRTMAPDILAMDEVTAFADMPAIEEAAGCGVRLLTTVHGQNRKSLEQKPMFAQLLRCGIFERLVEIRKEQGQRMYTVERLL